jgi:hypothetical protein
MTRRLAFSLTSALLALWVLAASAAAAVPTVGSLEATNLQGVSALLKGEVNPLGLPTTYRFEYSTQANFAGALASPTTTAGAGAAAVPARAAIANLAPATLYHYRLIATNGSGSSSAQGTFATTQGFGFLTGAAGFGARVIADRGASASKAGLHPYQLDFAVGFRDGGPIEDQPGVGVPDGDLRDLDLRLPPGLFLNPAAVGRCTDAQFATPRSSPFEVSQAGESCQSNSQVGTVAVKTSRGGGEVRRFGLFNLTPPGGVAAQLGFAPYGSPVVFDLAIPQNADGSYTLALQARNVSQSLDLRGVSLSLWGTPGATSHDGERGNCLNELEPAFAWAKCTLGQKDPLAYLSLPTRCSSSLPFSVTASSWQQPAPVSAAAVNRNPDGAVTPLNGCASLHSSYAATGVLSDKKASSPSGYNFHLTNNTQTLTDPNFLVTPSTKKAVITLPAGVNVNPSVAAGLGTCSLDQYAAETALSAPGQGCPNASKIGDFSVRSPLFEAAELFRGGIYLATPDDPGSPGAENPFDSLIAVYLFAKLPGRGVQIRLAGRIDPNPASGNVIATFDGLPQIPYTDLDVNFRTGQRAFLITPPACGQARSQIEMTPWAQGLAPTQTSDGSVIETGISGGACPSGAPPFAPGASAGAYNSNVGSYTPYFIQLTRRDSEQEITSYSLVLPKGVTGKIAGIPFCPDAAIDAARRNRGFAETARPSCPGASQVGRTESGYGIGAALTYAPGRIYLAGPYHGAPLSLVTVNAATVGPFDLGTIVIRSAFQLDPLTAQLQIDSRASDPIPHILSGIPLHLRDIKIFIDRPQFTHNPSSCEASQLTSTLTGSGADFGSSADDSSASTQSFFQLLNCLTLGFKPKLGIRLRGGFKRGDFPQLRATYASEGPRDSNLKRMEVTMPHSLFLEQAHIRKICTRPQFAAEQCPAASSYGHAVAETSLFDAPLRGDVYLRSSSGQAPDLVANLRSGAIRIVVEGKISSAKQGIRVLFDNLPDAPIERFTMTLNGGKRGLLVNSANICAEPPLATVKALGQNNFGASFTTELRGQCKKKKKGKKNHRSAKQKKGGKR